MWVSNIDKAVESFVFFVKERKEIFEAVRALGSVNRIANVIVAGEDYFTFTFLSSGYFILVLLRSYGSFLFLRLFVILLLVSKNLNPSR